jgi:basic amino acid/polyamine antiporter, APA family
MQVQPDLKRTITTVPAVLLVVSSIIGSGVFKKIAPMAAGLHSPTLVILCWVVAGLLSLIGALCTAELAAMMPGSGGEYRYFAKVYGKFFAFLYGWTNLTVVKASTIAALAFIFSESFNVLIPLPAIHVMGVNISIKMLGTLLIVALSTVNCLGVTFSELLSRIMIILILLVMFAFVIAGLNSDKGSIENFSPGTGVPGGWALFSAIFAASLGAFWGYEGWNTLSYLGDEIKNPQKNIPIALGIGTIIVIIIYLSLNAIYMYVLPVDQLAAINDEKNTIAAVKVAGIISGKIGLVVLSMLILFSTFNCENSTILTSARVLYAMSRDGLFFRGTAKIHPSWQTPANAVILQGSWAVALMWFGDFERLTDLLIFAAFIFYGASALGVLIMRRRAPDAVRPYKTIGYPVLPVLFVAFCIVLIVATIIRQPVDSGLGLLLIALGAPVYFYYVSRREPADPLSPA